uniref:Uncharacterized protein n=1 Tax=Daphnia magna TaxID=35525 RepID=A0A0N8D7Q3_9CRUS
MRLTVFHGTYPTSSITKQVTVHVSHAINYCFRIFLINGSYTEYVSKRKVRAVYVFVWLPWLLYFGLGKTRIARLPFACSSPSMMSPVKYWVGGYLL